MKQDPIDDRLLAVLKPFMRRLPEGFSMTAATALADDLNIDSADMIDLAMAVEERFAIVIEDEQVARVRTVGDLVSLVEELSAERKG